MYSGRSSSSASRALMSMTPIVGDRLPCRAHGVVIEGSGTGLALQNSDEDVRGVRVARPSSRRRVEHLPCATLRVVMTVFCQYENRLSNRPAVVRKGIIVPWHVLRWWRRRTFGRQWTWGAGACSSHGQRTGVPLLSPRGPNAHDRVYQGESRATRCSGSADGPDHGDATSPWLSGRPGGLGGNSESCGRPGRGVRSREDRLYMMRKQVCGKVGYKVG